MPDLSETIAQVAAEPKQAEADGQSAENQPLPDLIEADKYLAGKAAVGGLNSAGGPRSAWRGLRAARGVPPGAQ